MQTADTGGPKRTTDAQVEPWDVAITLRDLCFEMLDFHRAGASADTDTVRRWHQSIAQASRAHAALAIACEDVVEFGASDERLAALKQALTHAMGQRTYWPRADRW